MSTPSLPPRNPSLININPADIADVLCGWADCRIGADISADVRVPEGWRALVVSKYSLLERSGVLRADVDMVLCPEHVGALRRLLKKTAS